MTCFITNNALGYDPRGTRIIVQPQHPSPQYCDELLDELVSPQPLECKHTNLEWKFQVLVREKDCTLYRRVPNYGFNNIKTNPNC